MYAQYVPLFEQQKVEFEQGVPKHIWFEYLIDPSILENDLLRLQKLPASLPSSTDLMLLFLEQVEVLGDEKNFNARYYALLDLTAKVIIHLEIPLHEIENVVPLKLQWPLILGLPKCSMYTKNEKGKLNQREAYLYYVRWVVRCVAKVQSQFVEHHDLVERKSICSQLPGVDDLMKEAMQCVGIQDTHWVLFYIDIGEYWFVARNYDSALVELAKARDLVEKAKIKLSEMNKNRLEGFYAASNRSSGSIVDTILDAWNRKEYNAVMKYVAKEGTTLPTGFMHELSCRAMHLPLDVQDRMCIMKHIVRVMNEHSRAVFQDAVLSIVRTVRMRKENAMLHEVAALFTDSTDVVHSCLRKVDEIVKLKTRDKKVHQENVQMDQDIKASWNDLSDENAMEYIDEWIDEKCYENIESAVKKCNGKKPWLLYAEYARAFGELEVYTSERLDANISLEECTQSITLFKKVVDLASDAYILRQNADALKLIASLAMSVLYKHALHEKDTSSAMCIDCSPYLPIGVAIACANIPEAFSNSDMNAWISKMEHILLLSVRTLVDQLCDSSVWRCALGDIRLCRISSSVNCKTTYRSCIQDFLISISIRTNYFEEGECKLNLLLDEGYLVRLIYCLVQDGAILPAVILCQNPDASDQYRRGFQLLERNVHTHDISYFQFIWDISYLEMLINIHARQTPPNNRKLNHLIKVMQCPELSFSNPSELHIEMQNRMLCVFLRTLLDDYSID